MSPEVWNANLESIGEGLVRLLAFKKRAKHREERDPRLYQALTVGLRTGPNLRDLLVTHEPNDVPGRIARNRHLNPAVRETPLSRKQVMKIGFLGRTLKKRLSLLADNLQADPHTTKDRRFHVSWLSVLSKLFRQTLLVVGCASVPEWPPTNRPAGSYSRMNGDSAEPLKRRARPRSAVPPSCRSRAAGEVD
jgi:hypothetical protein